MIISLIFNFEIDWLKFKNKNFKLDQISKKTNLKRIFEIDNRLKKRFIFMKKLLQLCLLEKVHKE